MKDGAVGLERMTKVGAGYVYNSILMSSMFAPAVESNFQAHARIINEEYIMAWCFIIAWFNFKTYFIYVRIIGMKLALHSPKWRATQEVCICDPEQNET